MINATRGVPARNLSSRPSITGAQISMPDMAMGGVKEVTALKQRNVITAAIAVAGLVVATGASAVSAHAARAVQAAQGPAIELIAAQHTITAQRFGNQVFVDPGIWVASLTAPLQLEAKIALGDIRGRIDHMAVDLITAPQDPCMEPSFGPNRGHMPRRIYVG